MRINTNLIAMNTYNQYTKNTSTISSAVQKLSSGYAINSAADNAAGLAISEKMRAQIRGLDMASSNSQDAISLVQTADGQLASSHDILQTMRQLAVQSSSDTNEDSIDRSALQDEFSQLQSELNDISKDTAFNGKNLLDGSLAATTKSVTDTSLKNSGMTVTLGDASTGYYNFSVTTKLESAAVAGATPNSFGANLDATGGYFTASNVTGDANLKASDLLNGNYTLSATYDQNSGSITVKAKSGNDKTLQATLTGAQLATLAASTSLDIDFGGEAKDAVKLNLTLKDFVGNTPNNYTALASKISNITMSISGGVTQKDAAYGVYANLTGADSVKLSSGMSSVTFNNGVTVNFNNLTTSQLDTSNKAGISLTTGATIGNGTSAWSNLIAQADSNIANGAVTVTIAVSGNTATFTATDAQNHTYTATAVTGDLVVSAGTGIKDTALTFTDNTTHNAAFTLNYETDATTAGATVTADAGTALTVSNAGHAYEAVFGASTTDMSSSTASNFSVEARDNAGLTFQVGANQGDEMVINIEKMDSNTLGIASSSVATQSQAESAISAVDTALNKVSTQRAYLGAIQNRLTDKISNLNTSSENLTSAESQIRDVDMAKEMTTFTNANILQQAATAMLAQANSLPQNVLSLLK